MGLVDEWSTAYRVSYSNDTSAEYKFLKDTTNDVTVCFIYDIFIAKEVIALMISFRVFRF